jgi:cytochrome P450
MESEPSIPNDPHFEAELGSWVLARYEDVLLALRDPRLLPRGTAGMYDVAHHVVREAAAQALNSARLAAWRIGLSDSAGLLAGGLPIGVPVDLVGSFAVPLSQSLAIEVAGVAPDEAGRLSELAREIFLDSAEARPDSTSGATSAVAELGAALTSGGAADVQTFVAISQTLPCLMASIWLQLFRSPEHANWLRRKPELLPTALDELLRLASPTHAVFRVAGQDLEIGSAKVRRGERVTLLLAVANRDPARFPTPNVLDFERKTVSHLTFGAGIHSCSGARLVRMALQIATEALFSVTSGVEVTDEVEWLEGFAIRGPSKLPVLLSARRSGEIQKT